MKKETKIPEAGSQQPKNKFVVFAQSIWSRIIPSSKKEVADNRLNAKKPLIVLTNSQKLGVDENDANLFYDLENEKLSIRVIKQKDKDRCIFATSIPHKFEEVDASLMKNAIPQLVRVKISETHELLITKSPAVKFSDIVENILDFIINHVYNVNTWVGEEVVFIVKKFDGYLSFSSNIPLCRLKGLDKKLGLVKGLKITESGSPLGFDNSSFLGLEYTFLLFYGDAFSWSDLKPKIEEVLKDYFNGNIKFKYKRYI